MSKISIEGNPVLFSSPDSETGLPDDAISGHLLLIFEDDLGEERVISGFPESQVLFRWGNLVIRHLQK